MKYAHLNENNQLLGWYDDEIHEKIPTPNVKVSDEAWDEALSINANYYNQSTKKFETKDFRTEAEKLEDLKAQKRVLKQERLEKITVTTQKGNTFDGNETARNNMLSAIQSATYLNQTEHNWKMANNEVVLITLDELKEALALAIKKVGEIVTNEE